MRLEEFIEKRHGDLLILIRKINTPYQQRKTPELITDLWLEMSKRNMTISTENDFWFFSVKYINNRLKWKDGIDIEIGENGTLKYKTQKNKNKSDSEICYERNYHDIYERDRFTEDQLTKIELIEKIYDKMDFYDRQLYDYYFTDKWSIDRITEEFNNKGIPISRSSVYNMIRELIQKIKDKV